jgi:hypothetical protein
MKFRKKRFNVSISLWNTIVPLLSGIAFLYISSCIPVSTEQKGLTTYEASNIIGYNNKPVIVDYYFLDSMNQLNYYAKQNHLTLFVTSSFRKANQKVNGAIVPPAKRSNHLAGHAIDMNIESNGKWYDSKLLRRKNLKNLPHNIQNFFNDIRKDKTLRWGGDFSRQDPVHIDDYLNKNHEAWQERFDIVQKKHLSNTYK